MRNRNYCFCIFFIGVVFCSGIYFAQELTPLASKPDWSLLQQYADTITPWQLEELLKTVYVPDGSWKNWITIKPEQALIQPYPGAAPEKNISLPLATSNAEEKSVPHYWKKGNERAPHQGKPLAGLSRIVDTLSAAACGSLMPATLDSKSSSGRMKDTAVVEFHRLPCNQQARTMPRDDVYQLSGLKIVIDPGHLGGSWAKMEERWFRIKNYRPVEEGTMTFITAKILAARLTALGADVMLTRNHLGPTTPLRPYQLRKAAMEEISKENVACTKIRLQKMEELLFYRVAEIHHRAERINHDWRPDLVICLHFNAEDWHDPKYPTLSENNHLHLLISGDFGDEELQNEDVRYTMLCKLLSRTHGEEVDLSNNVAQELAAATGLPPFIYHNPSKALPASLSNPYLWNRNLLATRLYECPVIYCEAYVMNNVDTFERVQLGNYSGRRSFHGKQIPSIYHEYADAVAKGVENYFGNKVPK